MKTKVLMLAALAVYAVVLSAQASAQEQMSKKDVKETVLKVREALKKGQYERAIILSHRLEGDELRGIVGKKDLPLYDSVMAVCGDKMAEFQANEAIVVRAREAFNNRDYQEALDALGDRVFDKSNSYEVAVNNARVVREQAVIRLEQQRVEAEKKAREEEARRIEEERWNAVNAYDVAFGAARGALDALGVEKFIEKKAQPVGASLYYILNLDVFRYFDLPYDTDLKKELFKETDEYKAKLAELKALRDGLGRQVYWQKVENTKTLENYDIKSDSFPIWIGNNGGYYFTSTWVVSRPDHAISSDWPVVFKGFPSRRVPGYAMERELYRDQGLKDEYLFLPVPRAKAAEIEGKCNCEVYVLFAPGKIEDFKYDFVDKNRGRYTTSWYTRTQSCLTSNVWRIVVVDEAGKIVVDYMK